MGYFSADLIEDGGLSLTAEKYIGDTVVSRIVSIRDGRRHRREAQGEVISIDRPAPLASHIDIG